MSTEINLDELYNNSVKILSDLISFKTISGTLKQKLLKLQYLATTIKNFEVGLFQQ